MFNPTNPTIGRSKPAITSCFDVEYVGDDGKAESIHFNLPTVEFRQKMSDPALAQDLAKEIAEELSAIRADRGAPDPIG